MNAFWKKSGEKIGLLTNWALDNHPGKFIGSLMGLILALLIIIIGFWQTLFLIALAAAGFYIGKLWDDGLGLPIWAESLKDKFKYIRMWKYNK